MLRDPSHCPTRIPSGGRRFPKPRPFKGGNFIKNTKTALVVVCAILLVAASIMGTLAYLTDTTDEVKNTFSVGKVTITLDEAKINTNGEPLDEDGKVVDDANLAERVTENTYVMIPGHEYTKDPTIHVAADSEDCYLFVTIDNGIASVEHTIAGQLDRTDTGIRYKWTAVEGYSNLYCYTVDGDLKKPNVVHGGSTPYVFKTITIDETATYAQLEALKNADAKIEINAYAVQVDGFKGKTAMEIWEAAFADNTIAKKQPVSPTPVT